MPNQDPIAVICDSDNDPWESWARIAPAQLMLDGSDSFDPDGDELTYVWSIENGAQALTAVGEVIPIELAEVGAYEVTLTVTDPLGASASTSLPWPVEILPEDVCIRPLPEAFLSMDYESSLEEWKGTACDEPGIFDAVGVCDDLRFIKYAGAYTGSVRYYDADTGECVGGKSWTDVASGPCDGIVYYGRKIECETSARILHEEVCRKHSSAAGANYGMCGAMGAVAVTALVLVTMFRVVGNPLTRRSR